MRPTLLIVTTLALALTSLRAQNDKNSHDVLIYGATSAGVVAAIQADRMGAKVLLVEPGRHVGGLSSGGLGATDIGNKAAIGGLARDFYRAVHAHYTRPESWRQERRDEYRSVRRVAGEDTMWTFEPHVAEAIFEEWLASTSVTVLRRAVLARDHGVVKKDGRLESIRLSDGRVLRARSFIDASYEGDLLAEAGVPFRIGRESNAAFRETLNGVQFTRARAHQFRHAVDPFRVPGDPKSGLLPGIEAGPLEVDGTGDHRVQAYCFRMCLTDAPSNRLPVSRPEGYDERDHELLFRYFEAGFDRLPWHRIAMPNRKTDINNNHAVSTDAIGLAHGWASATHRQRQVLFDAHRRYQQGLVWTLQNHPRVPKAVRAMAAPWGLCRDEYADSDHWGHQLYVREGRRMRGRLMMTEAHCRGAQVADDAVGLAAYTMDSHHVRRLNFGGVVSNEGDVQVGGFDPYPIGLDALLPLRRDARNLAVPVALSATHIAYGSIRMEPVFMVLGQSAATAAVLALKAGRDLQDVDRGQLRERLLADGQRLNWKPGAPEIDPQSLPGLVLDDDSAELQGTWTESRGARPFVGRGYRHDGAAPGNQARARFRGRIAKSGRYALRIAYTAHANRHADARIVLGLKGERREFRLDQRQAPRGSDPWHLLGTFEIEAATEVSVLVSRGEGPGHLVVDAVQFLPRP